MKITAFGLVVALALSAEFWFAWSARRNAIENAYLLGCAMAGNARPFCESKAIEYMANHI